jgi:hypothetical protein
MKQTAVEWLYNHLFPKQLDGFSDEEWSKIDLAFEKAKEMEKQQIIDAVNFGDERGKITTYSTAEEYYNETFNL